MKLSKRNVKESNDATSNTIQFYYIQANFTEIDRRLTQMQRKISDPHATESITFPDLDGQLRDVEPVLALLEKRDRVITGSDVRASNLSGQFQLPLDLDNQYAQLTSDLKYLENNQNYIPGDLYNKLSRLKDRLRNFASLVIDQAERRQRTRERQYRYCQIVSYFVFVLGWGLALAGQLLGIGDLAKV